MAKQMQIRRLIWLAILLAAAFAGLGYRLVDLQVLRHQDLSAKAEQNTHSEFLLEPRRGDILDTRGNLYWIQESERAEPGGDLVFAMGESGVPQVVPELFWPHPPDRPI